MRLASGMRPAARISLRSFIVLFSGGPGGTGSPWRGNAPIRSSCGDCDWSGASASNRPPGAPSAGPAIADKAEKQQRRGKRAQGLGGQGGRAGFRELRARVAWRLSYRRGLRRQPVAVVGLQCQARQSVESASGRARPKKRPARHFAFAATSNGVGPLDRAERHQQDGQKSEPARIAVLGKAELDAVLTLRRRLPHGAAGAVPDRQEEAEIGVGFLAGRSSGGCGACPACRTPSAVSHPALRECGHCRAYRRPRRSGPPRTG